ncbi:MAG: glutamine-hydrolyzing GMP synthase [Opitutae bacterium]|nr:glutamine-hydrolyzing GMP synthase [Opitutae bacterium]MBT4224293.1 glutamine-hydrolyzing GMP synthase [Opitutae bacterium]MBT5380297.1 glutamine-hydrolyzing GMP synthase [Opitutae bacterium]MBT5691374.1 glutamine-hydrolyzing GMP synthase [Opitutae bacterium]MBT6463651.1 glutamine-hydrolyzing GMP synthase [Opitutae bacterium]
MAIIAVLDFGSQYTQVIARRIRESQVLTRIYHYTTSAAKLESEGVEGIILSGGPASVLAEGSPRPDSGIFNLGVPVLGICYGLQLMATMLGGKVGSSNRREYGRGHLKVNTKDCPLLVGVPQTSRVWNSHGDKIESLPEGFMQAASTENSGFAAVEDRGRSFFGLQFHPEVVHTDHGKEILNNFIFGVCACQKNWTMSGYIEKAIDEIRQTVGDQNVILGLSGGVDSSVAAALLHQAIGSRLTCVFVDNGLLRKGERAKVEKLYSDNFNLNLKVVDASAQFLATLAGITDPEAKRKAIGHVFIEVFEEAINDIGNVQFLGQGTLYPDVIESVNIAGNPSAVIKSHHNVGGLPEKMNLQLLEPLRELFKDEVRALGAELGLSKEVLWRQPFPGPGLGVRVIGDITVERLDILREADAILEEEMFRAGLYYKLWQSFCVFLPVRTVGVMGDERTYDNVIALRLVESIDAMTADWAQIPNNVLQIVSNRIINEVKGVNRVVLDISSKPPATIEWE